MKTNLNIDVFVMNSRFENAKYFLAQGHVLGHLVDRFKWHIYPQIYHVAPFPDHVDIESSNVCQMACPMCKRHLMTAPKGLMDFELYKKIIDECTQEDVYSIKLSWRGEPLLHPRLFDMVSYAKERGIREVAFLTNAERLDRQKAKELILSGTDWIGVSFDGLGETYESIRCPAKFEEAVEGIEYVGELKRKMGRRKPLIKIQTIWSAIKDDPEEFLEFWKPRADRVMSIADQLRSNDKADFEHDPNYVCPSAWQRLCVAWDGSVAQCHSDYNMEHVLGDVKNQTLREIWHGKEMKLVRELHRKRKRLELLPCQTCNDGGVLKEKVVEIGGKKAKVPFYEGQELDLSQRR